MVPSKLSGLSAAAALFLAAQGFAGAAAAADACKASFDDYGDPAASVACDCPALAMPGIVYGTLVYTSDSDICTAARHAGQIDAAAGTVKLRGTGGCQTYPGSVRNGVTSETWGAWDRSYYFPGTHDGSCQVDVSATPGPTPAPMPGPAPAGDALSVILAFLQAAPPGAFTYGNATSLGPDAFEFTDVVVVPEGPDSKVTIGRMRVENLDLAGVMQGGAPAHARLVLENMLLTPENSDMDDDVWELLGARSALTNLVLDYTMDAATRGFTLKDFTVDLQGIGKATLAFDLAGVGAEALMAPEAALFQGSLKSASLAFQDETFLARILEAGIKETGQPEQQVVGIALQELANALGEMGAQPGDRFFDAGAKIGGMLLDAKSPKGPLTITVSPAQPVNFMQLNQLENPGAAADLLNLQVTYAGSSAPLPAPIVSEDVTTSAFVYTDKDVYASGETVVVFWDGTPGNATDWVNVVPVGAPPEEWGQFAYTNGQVYGSTEFHGLTPGQYEARVFYNYPDGGFVPQATYNFTIQ
jgi:hypothetical protein